MEKRVEGKDALPVRKYSKITREILKYLEIFTDIQKYPEIFGNIMEKGKSDSDRKTLTEIKGIFPPAFPEPLFLYP
ncbi:hypothetical protein [Methanosarcina sp. DH2]|uniref:hypothetical protein n=1 Tax=Methanosarcina sp. DH2 TaxID=2605639 RepID=UPI001E3111CD|nr:hypothetical protein [Methanosarcina sp. DH2]